MRRRAGRERSREGERGSEDDGEREVGRRMDRKEGRGSEEEDGEE